MSGHSSLEATLLVAETVLEELHRRALDGVVIGATALAAHGYPRATADLDIAVATQPAVLKGLAESLRGRGYEVDVSEPDPDDPLGGVVDVRGAAADLVQIVNFDNPPANGFPRLVTDSLAEASPLVPGRALRVVDPYHLIAFKLYAGGSKSKLDVLELLARVPGLDRSRLRRLCEDYRLSAELDELLPPVP